MQENSAKHKSPIIAISIRLLPKSKRLQYSEQYLTEVANTVTINRWKSLFLELDFLRLALQLRWAGLPLIVQTLIHLVTLGIGIFVSGLSSPNGTNLFFAIYFFLHSLFVDIRKQRTKIALEITGGFFLSNWTMFVILFSIINPKNPQVLGRISDNNYNVLVCLLLILIVFFAGLRAWLRAVDELSTLLTSSLNRILVLFLSLAVLLQVAASDFVLISNFLPDSFVQKFHRFTIPIDDLSSILLWASAVGLPLWQAMRASRPTERLR